MRSIIQPLEPQQRELCGKQTIKLRHNLASNDLFSDDSLAKLIETAAPKSLAMHTEGGHDPSNWPVVARGDAPGARVLDAARHGKLWINLVGITEWDSRFAELADQVFAEFANQVPGLDVVKHKLGVLISSPRATVHYHVDIPGQAIWQLRGRKRFMIYPASEPFLKPVELEAAVRSATYGVASYQPWYDDYAEVHDLAPGEALHWPLNGPHRIENFDELSVSLTSEHWTPDIRRTYAMNYGNGLLRRYGWTPRSRAVSGPAFWAKVGLTAAYRRSGLQNRLGYQRIPTFVVDPDGPNGVRPLA